MILQYDAKRYVVNLDWFSFSCMLPNEPEMVEIECPVGMRCEVCKPTKQYQNRCIFYDPIGVKMLTCLWQPYSKVIPSRLMLVEIGNAYLYDNRLNLAWSCLNSITEVRYNNPSRIDVCCDFEKTKRESRVIDNLWNHKYYVVNKHMGSLWWSGDWEPHDMNWGNIASQFKWKLYNKSKELGCDRKLKDYDKPYIVANWLDANMNIRNIWRLEVSITNVSKFNYLGRVVNITDIMQNEIVVMLFFEQYERRFQIRKKQKHTRKSNDEHIKFLPFSFDRLNLTKFEPKDRRLYAGQKEFFNILRQIETSTAILQSPSLLQMYMDLAKEIVIKFNLGTHLLYVYGNSYEQMIEESYFKNLSRYGQNY